MMDCDYQPIKGERHQWVCVLCKERTPASAKWKKPPKRNCPTGRTFTPPEVPQELDIKKPDPLPGPRNGKPKRHRPRPSDLSKAELKEQVDTYIEDVRQSRGDELTAATEVTEDRILTCRTCKHWHGMYCKAFQTKGCDRLLRFSLMILSPNTKCDKWRK